MVRPIIKVCGVRSESIARLCVRSGVDLAGLTRVVDSRRYTEFSIAKHLSSILGPRAVAVYRDEDPRDLLRDARRLGVSTVQVHGSESPQDLAFLRQQGLRVIRAFSGLPTVGALRASLPFCSLIIVDGSQPGSGEPWAWEQLRRLPTLQGLPLLAAGGVNPENASRVLRHSKAWGIDLASGIERDGLPCPWRIRKLVRILRGS